MDKNGKLSGFSVWCATLVSILVKAYDLKNTILFDVFGYFFFVRFADLAVGRIM